MWFCFIPFYICMWNNLYIHNVWRFLWRVSLCTSAWNLFYNPLPHSLIFWISNMYHYLVFLFMICGIFITTFKVHLFIYSSFFKLHLFNNNKLHLFSSLCVYTHMYQCSLMEIRGQLLEAVFCFHNMNKSQGWRLTIDTYLYTDPRH